MSLVLGSDTTLSSFANKASRPLPVASRSEVQLPMGNWSLKILNGNLQLIAFEL